MLFVYVRLQMQFVRYYKKNRLLQNAVSRPKQKIDTSKKFWRIAVLSNSPELFINVIFSKFYFATGPFCCSKQQRGDLIHSAAADHTEHGRHGHGKQCPFEAAGLFMNGETCRGTWPVKQRE